MYSDRPVFTPKKEIRTIFASSEATWSDPSELRVTIVKHNSSTVLNWKRFSKISPKLFEIWQIDQFNIKNGKIHIQTCSVL